MLKKHSMFSLRRRFFARFKNTFLQIPCLWNLVINSESFKTQHSTKLRRLFMKVIWFWPRLIDAEQWRDGAVGAKRDPSHFVDIDPHSRVLIDTVKKYTPNSQDSILDIGCNCGRILNNLCENGYYNLFGVDISEAAYEYMKTTFSNLSTNVDYSVSTFQDYLSKCRDESFNTTYSLGATIELVHPSFPLIKHICRVTKSYVILVIDEAGQSYPRFWEWEFNRYGFVLVEALRPADPSTPNSLLVFNRAER